MTSFDCVINFFESFILSYFIYRYFYLSLNQRIITNIIVFLEITLGNYFFSSSFLPVILVVCTMIVLLRVFGLRTTIELIVINVSIMLIDMICNMIALVFVSFLTTSGFVFTNVILRFNVAIIISKFLFLLFAILFSKIKLDLNAKLDTKRWTGIVALFFLILLEGAILIQNLIQNNINKSKIFFCVVLTGIISILVWEMYKNILLENDEKMQILLKTEAMKYKKENYKTLSKMSEEIYQLDHNMRYLLMMLKYAITKKNYEESLLLIDDYIKKYDKFKILINTNNPYFDFLLNQELNALLKEKIDVNTLISISQNDFYLNKEYMEYIILIINTFKVMTKKIAVNIQEVEGNNLLNLSITRKNNEKLIFNNRFYDLINYLDAQYTIDYIDDLIVFKSIQKMTKNT
ncbi:hypothetical protein DW801_06620 [Coprobacillus sp. AM32-11LB]|uniref:hypothetical protein n=1 Tax=Faecalibacillus intestinalis TaxID=1982626 RepID=UPI000E4DB3D0|nr:hypothetical protein [Faecalibacillus intestinalis]RHT34694.1 hypothetical protein DW801_06620 [Coprobacillus sp. AM32-11LB]